MLTLELAKQHLEYEDSDRDALIEQYIAAAAGWVESFTGLLLTRRAVTRRFNGRATHYSLGVGPDAVVDSLTYVDSSFDENTIDASDYRVVGSRLYPVSSFPSAPYGIEAVITAGYADAVPAELTSAQLLIIGHLFANRETVVTGTIASSVPLAAEALCTPYRALYV